MGEFPQLWAGTQYMYTGLISWVSVFLSWCALHRACQLLRSQKSRSSPRCGMMWSTTVAFWYRPSLMHSTHSGCAFKYSLLAFCHALPYPLLPADRTSSGWRDLCLSQYLLPLGTSSAHPGCLQGTLGLLGILRSFPPPDLFDQPVIFDEEGITVSG